MKNLLLQVGQTPKGPRVVVSRSHPNLLRRLFEMEVPEVYNGTVEIKTIAREAGFRSKVAVTARQGGLDPVGCCVGLRGNRIQNIVNELGGEKIDVITWNDDPRVFIANALSPAHIISVSLNEETEVATVIVPDKQLSLAIGKEGQNARLAAKIAGWRIDIKSASAAEAEKLAKVEEAKPKKAAAKTKAAAASEAAAPAAVEASAEAEPLAIPDEIVPETTIEEDLTEADLLALEEEAAEEPEPEAEEVESTVLSADALEMPEIIVPEVLEDVPQIRFAEDIMGMRPARPEGKNKKKKKKKTAQRDSGAASAPRTRGTVWTIETSTDSTDSTNSTNDADTAQ